MERKNTRIWGIVLNIEVRLAKDTELYHDDVSLVNLLQK